MVVRKGAPFGSKCDFKIVPMADFYLVETRKPSNKDIIWEPTNCCRISSILSKGKLSIMLVWLRVQKYIGSNISIFYKPKLS